MAFRLALRSSNRQKNQAEWRTMHAELSLPSVPVFVFSSNLTNACEPVSVMSCHVKPPFHKKILEKVVIT